MATVHYKESELQEKINAHKQKRLKSIPSRAVITGILIFISSTLGSPELWDAFLEWANAPENLPDSFLVGIVIAIGIMAAYPLQLFFRYVLPLILVVTFFRDSLADGLAKGDSEQILEAGLAAEKEALRYLSALPDTYHIFNNLHIPYQNGVSETDLIAVGPTGLFIIEVKGHTGTLSGDWSDTNLSHIKERGDPKTLYNPVKQVATHVYRLSGYMRTNQIKTWIDGCVFFINPNLQLDVTNTQDKDIAVFTCSAGNDLLRYIQTPRQNLAAAEVTAIVNHLKKLS